MTEANDEIADASEKKKAEVLVVFIKAAILAFVVSLGFFFALPYYSNSGIGRYHFVCDEKGDISACDTKTGTVYSLIGGGKIAVINLVTGRIEAKDPH